MFDSLTEVLDTEGCGIHGFQKCAALALEQGAEDAVNAAPCLLLAAAAEQFVNLYEGQPLPTEVAEEEYRRFSAYVAELGEAFASGEENKRVAAMNGIAAGIIESKRA
ncbi:hypothetical protein DND132_2792 [Pseudodesulfovibrio mercurii]|uniref:Uncharacterized protein n=1 Tax=Pseudodesulfovibrio mercurii TaxID=641491 RepID=F0JJ96_9BACT|nr:hypothetical protein [Pseudodesulfovibrio mercurii]EGB15995.1 hypothetical protein DND132_2792 [Pseudodesulfovibrio mercurii]